MFVIDDNGICFKDVPWENGVDGLASTDDVFLKPPIFVQGILTTTLGSTMPTVRGFLLARGGLLSVIDSPW